MKLNYIFTTILALLAIPTWAGDVAINETNFPDANFRNYLLARYYGQDGILTEEEISKITSIEVSYKQISSLQGIEFFTALTDLSCLGNQLTSLDVSHNTALRELDCGKNRLTSLDVSHNTALTSLECYNNQLTSLDVSGATALEELDCYENQLTSLDVSGATALTILYCDYNQLPSLDVSQNTALTKLYCHSNQLTSLDVSGATALTSLGCPDNQLTSLDVSHNTALTRLMCFNNQIKGTEMDNLVNSLPINDSKYKEFYVYGGEKDGNVCTTVQVAVAKSRGWTPWYWYLETGERGEYAGSDPSGIEDVTISGIEDAPVYNLSGQRLSAPQKGINIVNGKKVMKK